MSKEQKLAEAQALLKALGMPKAQCNQRSAWVLLALAKIRPQDEWRDAQNPLLTTVQIMEFLRNNHYRDYKPNTRETIRRQTLHQFEQARIVNRNSDKMSRPTHSKDNNYSLTEHILDILHQYPDGDWEERVEDYKNKFSSLEELYRRKLDMQMIPVRLPNGERISLSPGDHNQLHADIIHQFCPRFIGDAGRVLYIGDTASSRKEGGKFLVMEEKQLDELGVPSMTHDKLPDIVVYDQERKWLFLIEAVTSHGPISPKRWFELEKLLENCKVGRVYVTAFPDNATFRKHVKDIAWETEVWISTDPDHMIHFDGERFLGPYESMT